MISNKDDNDKDQNLAIQREILSGRQFSIAEAIGREGGSFLKGESPVPKLAQAIAELQMFIKQNLSDSSGALQAVLYVWVQTDSRVSQHPNSPLIALKEILSALIDNQNLLYEFVRQVDQKWGEMYDERPYFQQPEQLPHPQDEYTHESVRLKLIELLDIVKSHN
ncbi:conserved hypothetical protein [Hyella patelloides LEGE 07179]|uniref:Uncharacterized protein n=1 Tax=Hyella patelloides LEGE 07179 TaxID=945734 RepID=A0A563W5C9_9CYAN|nr:hypothetical protein [Hyella patelloides]VEP18888.1 conserved hypothetical protein [Hyella patelloides LEGE 07179]